MKVYPGGDIWRDPQTVVPLMEFHLGVLWWGSPSGGTIEGVPRAVHLEGVPYRDSPGGPLVSRLAGVPWMSCP
jgi:hypothetical protein